MKTLSLLFVSLLGSLFMNAQNITVTIDNVSNDNGKVIFALHTSDTFMKGPGIQNAETKIENGKAVVTFKDVKPGTYAIMALHDANENNQMDYEASGMPKEAYGMSNNPMSYGPPQFYDAKFEFKGEDVDMKIRF